jgi:hypothetical protein
MWAGKTRPASLNKSYIVWGKGDTRGNLGSQRHKVGEGEGQKAWPLLLLDRMVRHVEGHDVEADKRDGRPDTEMDKLQVGRQAEVGLLWHLLQQ